MATYFLIEPEVAGELGADTAIDSSVHPPRVLELHYEFKGWLGDDLLESFPCYVVTDRCKGTLEKSGFSGCTFAPVKVTASDTFHALYPGRSLPAFHWLKVNGRAGEDDFWLSNDYRLVVSEAVLGVLRSFNIEHCGIEEFAD